MVADIFVPLATIGLAELGDKTQFSLLLLSTKTRNHLQLLLGALLAFLIVDGIAVLFCSWITNLLPVKTLRVVSGIIFIIIGIMMVRKDKEDVESSVFFKKPFILGFSFIFLTEWGDKTQIASGLFVTKYNALMVLTGTMLALTVLSLVAIYLGKIVSDRINKRVMTQIAGIMFLLIGISFLLF